MLASLLRDSRHTLRSFLRTPIFAVTAIASLAIGIGATSAIFTLVDSLLLKPPPGIEGADRLVNVGRSEEGSGFDTFSYQTLVDLRERTTTLESLVALQVETKPMSLGGADGGEAIEGAVVNGNFFDVLRTEPALGRFFLPEEDRVPARNPVAVLSHRFWQSRFGGDPSLVGGTVDLNGTDFTVVGVAGEGFRGPFVTAPDLWVPMMSATLLGSPPELLTDRRRSSFIGLGRLKDGVSIDAARIEMAAIGVRLQQEFDGINEGHGVSVVPASFFPGQGGTVIRAFMAFLLGLAGLVLLVAGTNVAGMLLARAAARRREIAVRLAIGASRGRLLQQLVTESVLLFLVAGALGLLLAGWIAAAITSMIPRLPFQLALDTSIDWRIVAFTAGLSLLAGVISGLFPGLQSTRPDLAPELRDSGGSSGGRQNLRRRLLVVQMGFSMILLVIAGLFGRALVTARSIDPGFYPGNVEVATLDLRLANYSEEEGIQFDNELLERASAIPGVESAALTRVIPLEGMSYGLGGLEVPGVEAPDEDEGWGMSWNVVSPGYFDVMRIPLVRGRSFTDADRAGAPGVAIMNQTLAEKIWPGEDAVGKTVQNGERQLTIVGVATDAKYRSLGEENQGFIYVPMAQRFDHQQSLLVRHQPGAVVLPAIGALVSELDPALPVLDDEPLARRVAIGLFPQQLALRVAGSLGAVALLLAVLGIYGVTAYSVAQRSREIGIRLALGAPRGGVLTLVLREGTLLAVFGILLGLGGALALTRLLDSLLFGVPAMDPLALTGASALLLGAAALASWGPARRAAAVDPASTLRIQ